MTGGDGLSEIYRDRHRPSPRHLEKHKTRFMITAPIFTIMNIAPTFRGAVVKKRILLPPNGAKKGVGLLIQHGSGKRGRLSVKKRAQQTTAIHGYFIRKDSEHRFCIATKPEAQKRTRGSAPMTPVERLDTRFRASFLKKYANARSHKEKTKRAWLKGR